MACFQAIYISKYTIQIYKMYIDLNLYTRETEQSSAHKNISTLYGVGTQDLLSFIKCMNGMLKNILKTSGDQVCE